jgi:hypothetical protein
MLVGIFTILVSVALQTTPGGAQSTTALIAQAIDVYYAGDYDRAVRLLDQALQREPNSISALLWQGVVYAESGLNRERAIVLLTRVNQLAPQSAESAQAIRWLLRLQGRPKIVTLSVYSTSAEHDGLARVVADGILSRIAAGSDFSADVSRERSNDRLLAHASQRRAGWVLSVGVTAAQASRSLIPVLCREFIAGLNVDVALFDAVLGGRTAQFDGGESACESSPSRGLDQAARRSGTEIWSRVAALMKRADDRVQEELGRVSLRTPVPGVYAFANRMDRAAANALPVMVVPLFGPPSGVAEEARRDATDIFSRRLLATDRFALLLEPELLKMFRTPGDAVSQATMLSSSRRLNARYVVVGHFRRLVVESTNLVLGTRLDVEIELDVRVLSIDGQSLADIPGRRKASRTIGLRRPAQVREQEALFRADVVNDVAGELVGGVAKTVGVPIPSDPATPRAPALTPGMGPVPSPTEPGTTR